jgi:hypothetical protein
MFYWNFKYTFTDTKGIICNGFCAAKGWTRKGGEATLREKFAEQGFTITKVEPLTREDARRFEIEYEAKEKARQAQTTD